MRRRHPEDQGRASAPLRRVLRITYVVIWNARPRRPISVAEGFGISMDVSGFQGVNEGIECQYDRPLAKNLASIFAAGAFRSLARLFRKTTMPSAGGGPGSLPRIGRQEKEEGAPLR